MQAAAAQQERSRAARVERLTVRVAREGERRHQAEDDARHQGQPRRPQHHDAVDGDLGLTREMHRPKPVQHADAQPRQQQAACAAEDGDDQVLGKELPHQTEPRRAERASDRQLTLTCLGARQEQVGDVDAGDEKDEPNRRAERHQRRLHVARDDLAEWPHGEAQPAWVRRRMARDETCRQCVELRLRLGDCCPRRDTSDQRQSPIEQAGRKVPRQQHIDALLNMVRCGKNEAKVGRQDADDLHVEVVDRQPPADHARIALEATLPQLVADDDAFDDDAVRVFRGDERSPERQRGCAQERQQIVRHPGRGDALHHAVDHEARVTSLDLGDARDQPALRSHVEHSAR